MAEEQKIAPEADSAAEENHIIAERRAKLQLLRDANAAYPNDFRRKDYLPICTRSTTPKTAKRLRLPKRLRFRPPAASC